jgi:hypothetical protein
MLYLRALCCPKHLFNTLSYKGILPKHCSISSPNRYRIVRSRKHHIRRCRQFVYSLSFVRLAPKSENGRLFMKTEIKTANAMLKTNKKNVNQTLIVLLTAHSGFCAKQTMRRKLVPRSSHSLRSAASSQMLGLFMLSAS